MTIALIIGAMLVAYIVGSAVGWRIRERLAGAQADMLCNCLDETSQSALTATAALGNALDERKAALVRAAVAEGLLREARLLLVDHGIPVPADIVLSVPSPAGPAA